MASLDDTKLKAPEKQVVSKKRVTDHGEIYAARRKVSAGFC